MQMHTNTQEQQEEVQGPQRYLQRARALQGRLRDQLEPAQDCGEEERITQRDTSTEYSIDFTQTSETGELGWINTISLTNTFLQSHVKLHCMFLIMP